MDSVSYREGSHQDHPAHHRVPRRRRGAVAHLQKAACERPAGDGVPRVLLPTITPPIASHPPPVNATFIGHREVGRTQTPPSWRPNDCERAQAGLLRARALVRRRPTVMLCCPLGVLNPQVALCDVACPLSRRKRGWSWLPCEPRAVVASACDLRATRFESFNSPEPR